MMLFCRIWKSSDLSQRSNIKDTLEKTRVNSLESAPTTTSRIMDIGWRRGTEGRQQSGPFVEATNMMV
ncbi:hypothetical protein AAZX31_20G141100 [Glycine max]|uniref:Uncharacterized protein n=1 Tax=Glycine max TaxID=3847 RepID=A0A0R0EMY8_SOYBN|nr:hypothetical protein JHK85_057338 [Glycine max]KAH1036243.1 hypothetical protein GYH30_055959 [Glycine max]KRG91416.1 hypothetical protein GLYMA_20G153500v4 [Glycine max]